MLALVRQSGFDARPAFLGNEGDLTGIKGL